MASARSSTPARGAARPACYFVISLTSNSKLPRVYLRAERSLPDSSQDGHARRPDRVQIRKSLDVSCLARSSPRICRSPDSLSVVVQQVPADEGSMSVGSTLDPRSAPPRPEGSRASISHCWPELDCGRSCGVRSTYDDDPGGARRVLAPGDGSGGPATESESVRAHPGRTARTLEPTQDPRPGTARP